MAAAWMGLAVKTDGAAVASGAITDALIRARALETGVAYEAGWILTTTTTVKVFIDVFIGVWALVLALSGRMGSNGSPGPECRFAKCSSDSRPSSSDTSLCSWLSSASAGPARHGQRPHGSHCRDGPLAGDLLRHDLLHHRDGVRPQTPLGGGNRPTGPGLRRQLVRIHHLDRIGDLVVVLPRGASADHQRRPLK